MNGRDVRVSKFLSLVLRHKPEEIGITLDSAGWVGVKDLLQASAAHAFPISMEELKRVVETNDKKRFAFSEDETRIRASQGHSVEVDLQYEPAVPPEILFHGTAERFLASIQAQGLLKGKRHHVHLSRDILTALKVGQRYGKPVLLQVKSGEMHREGQLFFISTNGVWLTDHVPPAHLEVVPAEKH
jgi:putative RNA 2'-phosphotransferase